MIQYRIQDSVAEDLRSLPKGDCEWPGYFVICNRLQSIALKMAMGKGHSYLSDDHLHTMAVLGCGHEETMKGWLLHLTDIGWKWEK